MYVSAREIINILDQITINFIIVLLVHLVYYSEWEWWTGSAFYSFI